MESTPNQPIPDDQEYATEEVDDGSTPITLEVQNSVLGQEITGV